MNYQPQPGKRRISDPSTVPHLGKPQIPEASMEISKDSISALPNCHGIFLCIYITYIIYVHAYNM